jgi:cell division protein FtsZ
MGILTVGIVTTPFAYEGKKRLQQAEEGIRQLRQQVDTLLVISNDKLRHQFGNLKMREAFEKADNVLATAARCITDVISSTGQINVDFADVCTVMRNGGRAILGHAQIAGENRAQLAIEEALNSPLLNDNDIRGAKWILININSSHGQHEFTMDEVEVIQHYLLSQTGENTDVILGMGYDDNLGDKLGITLIATGFDHKDNLSQPVVKKVQPVQEEKIVMVLGETEKAPVSVAPITSTLEPIQSLIEAPIAPPEELPAAERIAATDTAHEVLEESNIAPAHLMPTLVELVEEELAPLAEEKEEMVHFVLDTPSSTAVEMPVTTAMASTAVVVETDASFMAAAVLPPNNSGNTGISSGGYLTRPANIYADSYTEKETNPVATTPSQAPSPAPVEVATPRQEEVVPPVVQSPASPVTFEEEDPLEMQLVEKEETPSAQTPLLYELHASAPKVIEEVIPVDETMEQQRRAAERLQKLRNLSFNVNTADPNNEFETVPAYIRRNMEMYNSKSEIENFYSSYEVKDDPSKQGPISTINSFLEGKKPD